MANPDPEITPEEVSGRALDAIMATGRSDYPNQVNNVLGFPFIFRGALDVQASTINDAMKIAAAEALAELARAGSPRSGVAASSTAARPTFGPDYIIPAPFDPRLISHVPPAVAKAAMDSGVARRPIVDMDAYVARLKGRLDPVAGWLQSTFEKVRSEPQARGLRRRRGPGRHPRRQYVSSARASASRSSSASTDVVRERFQDARHAAAAASSS